MLKDVFPEEQVAAAGRLIDAISPTAEIAAEHRRQLLETDPEDLDQDPDEHAAMLWLLKEVVDWETGYFVDWKDTESFVGAVMQIASAWGATVTFGVDDPQDDGFLDEVDVPDLMARAHAELLPQGLVLWNWATDGDCYSGWITRLESKGTVAEIAQALDVDIREGDAPF